MLLHHFDRFQKFYLYSEEKFNLIEKNAEKGIGIPAFSTTVEPPLKLCSDDEIPIFKGSTWQVVKNDYWRPKCIEVNYDAGRSMDTFQYMKVSIEDFTNFPFMPQLCNTHLVVIRISESLVIINKKFSQCVEMHKTLLGDQYCDIINYQQKETMLFTPSINYELNIEIESIVFIMRRILDSLVQLTDLMVNFSKFEQTKTFNYGSIGTLLSSEKENMVKSIILGGDIYSSDDTKFLETSNNLFNAYKHSLMNDETFQLFSPDYLTFTGILVKNQDHKKSIQYHNHNAFHFMMGFQDTVLRILKNQKTYKINH